MKVYPRVYGGTLQDVGVGVDTLGLSPRVRGNRRGRGFHRCSSGSIPACTGEPTRHRCGSPATPVYPRVYGGTQWKSVAEACMPGLSPRVRGNPVEVRGRGLHAGSIPACTGEPSGSPWPRPACRVYPRVYGGTPAAVAITLKTAGLSPRVRGNLLGRRVHSDQAGSIPACTGEPLQGHHSQGPGGVYPRVYGGTCSRTRTQRPSRGLSPRVRGNLFTDTDAAAKQRSIPACTGEPGQHELRQHPAEVYPRVYGGTLPGPSGPWWLMGLSPRVRGNPYLWAWSSTMRRSIPACTGEPRPGSPSSRTRRVYPRVYGGTLYMICKK